MGFKPISASLKDHYLFRYIFLRTFPPIKEAKIKPNWQIQQKKKKPTGLDLLLGRDSFNTGFQACKFETQAQPKKKLGHSLKC